MTSPTPSTPDPQPNVDDVNTNKDLEILVIVLLICVFIAFICTLPISAPALLACIVYRKVTNKESLGEMFRRAFVNK